MFVLFSQLLLGSVVFFKHLDSSRSSVPFLLDSLGQLPFELDNLRLSLTAKMGIFVLIAFLEPFELVLQAVPFVAENVDPGSFLGQIFKVLGCQFFLLLN